MVNMIWCLNGKALKVCKMKAAQKLRRLQHNLFYGKIVSYSPVVLLIQKNQLGSALRYICTIYEDGCAAGICIGCACLNGPYPVYCLWRKHLLVS